MSKYEIECALAARDGGWWCTYCRVPLISWHEVRGEPAAWGFYGGRWSIGWGESSTGVATAEVDHVVPRCKGGTDELSNLALSCPTCNATKRDRTPEWLAEYRLKKPRHRWPVRYQVAR